MAETKIMNGLEYTLVNGYWLPLIEIPEEEQKAMEEPLGTFGQMRKRFLLEHKRWYLDNLEMKMELHQHLQAVDKAANEMFMTLIDQYAEADGATEELKARDPWQWIGIRNNAKARAREMVEHDLIYS